MGKTSATTAVAGISDHCGWAVVVCIANDRVLDVRQIELVESGLPSLPHHTQGQRLPIGEAVALVERVRASAESCARRALDELPAAVRGIAIRKRPALPPTVAERITSYWAQTRADSAMYRDVLVDAATDRGWSICEYDPKTVFDEATDVIISAHQGRSPRCKHHTDPRSDSRSRSSVPACRNPPGRRCRGSYASMI